MDLDLEELEEGLLKPSASTEVYIGISAASQTSDLSTIVSMDWERYMMDEKVSTRRNFVVGYF